MKSISPFCDTLLLAGALACLLLAATGNWLWQTGGTTSTANATTTTETHARKATATPGVNLAFGGMRGLLADWLWMRAAVLQDQGRYVELAQTADWITRLQPDIADVWILQSWNMAYNIPVLLPEMSERWRWVKTAMATLSVDGADATGDHPAICAANAWMLMHRVMALPAPAQSEMLPFWLQDQSAAEARDAALAPAFAKTLEQRYGIHDWRHPLSQAVYWASRGLTQDPDSKECARLLLQSLSALVRFGTLTYEPDAQLLVLTPDFTLVPEVLDTYDTISSSQQNPAFREAHRQAFTEIVQIMAFYQHEDANSTFSRLHTTFPSAATESGYDSFRRFAPPVMPLLITIPNTQDSP